MRCASCSSDNPEGAKFCIECAAPFKRRCPSCGTENPPQTKFCAECATPLTEQAAASSPVQRDTPPVQSLPPTARIVERAVPEAERRQLTVMFCDLVGSTALSEQLDPEELREVVRAYQETCTTVLQRYGGHIAQHLGDGLLVYFGYPMAHEDDAARAVRTGLGILEALLALNARLPRPIQVRIGIHTGLVVVGEIGSGEKREQLALGETPNIAARVQGHAEPDTVVISAATSRLVQGLFEYRDLGPQMLKGVSTPLAVYRVVGEGAVQSRFEAAVQHGLTPLVGREEELGLLQRRWTQAKEGAGQVVLLRGEAGIGKSRLVQELKAHLIAEGTTHIAFRCSPYHQTSALYPIIEHLQRLLQFAPHETPQAQLTKLQQALTAYHFPQADTLPLVAALLSLPHPEGTPPITLSPQKQKQKTQEALVAWIIEEAEKAAGYCTWEDLHWADPSTLELLNLLIEQVPTARLFLVLTFRPEFIPPWAIRSHLTQLTLSRLARTQTERMIERVAGSKALPSEVVQQIVSKTDGVPLFVEELTKMVVESVGAHSRAPLQSFDIPTTLHDSLMARLDRLGTAKEVAQIGATLGREFSYELIRAVSPVDEASLQQALAKLGEAEILYHRGLGSQTHYIFKHALIQDAAYQSLLKSTRQQYHKQIARVLEEQFAEAKETQPELLAYHYTEAGLSAQAIPYWQRAGEKTAQRSAYVEAIGHLTRGLDLLKALPDTPQRAQQELTLQIALSAPLIATKGWATPELEKACARARELCQQVGETFQLFPVLWGLAAFYRQRAEHKTAHELAEQYMRLAQSSQDPTLLLEAHQGLGVTSYWLGEVAPSLEHFEQGFALYDPQQHSSLTFIYGQDPGITCLCYGACALWLLGYPDQALKRVNEALRLAEGLSHPFMVVYARHMLATVYQFRREEQLAQEQVEAAMMLSMEQGFPYFLAWATVQQGSLLSTQGKTEEGIAQIRQGTAAWQAMGSELGRPSALTLLAEAYGKAGRTEEGLTLLAEALDLVHKTDARVQEPRMYRLKGELTLKQSSVQSLESSVQKKAEDCFRKALEIARKQSAKSLELRAVMSLSRLWQQQGKREEARQMLAKIYGWFTEGFDTADLQEAKALLQELT